MDLTQRDESGSPKTYNVLKVEVERGVELNGTYVHTIVKTRHEHGVVARTVISSSDFGRSIGGMRVVDAGEEYADDVEAVHLAEGMRLKNPAAGQRFDGQKSVISIPGHRPSLAARAEIAAAHIRAVLDVTDRAHHPVFGADMEVPEEVMDVLVRQPDLDRHISCVSTREHGLGIDNLGFTAVGLVEALTELCKIDVDIAGTAVTVGIQGFGAVGSHVARLITSAVHHANENFAVVAVNNETGTLRAKPGSALDIAALFNLQWHMRPDERNESLRSFHQDNAEACDFSDDRDLLFDTPVDILVLAARTNVLCHPDEVDALRAERPDVLSAERVAGVQVVVEGANHPLTDRARDYLRSRNVRVLPDFLVNHGGLVGAIVGWDRRSEIIAASGSNAAHNAIIEQALSEVRRISRDNVHALMAKLGEGTMTITGAARAIAEERRDALLRR